MDSMNNVNAETPNIVAMVSGFPEQVVDNGHTAGNPSLALHGQNLSSIMSDGNRPSSLQDVVSVQLPRIVAVVSGAPEQTVDSCYTASDPSLVLRTQNLSTIIPDGNRPSQLQTVTSFKMPKIVAVVSSAPEQTLNRSVTAVPSSLGPNNNTAMYNDNRLSISSNSGSGHTSVDPFMVLRQSNLVAFLPDSNQASTSSLPYINPLETLLNSKVEQDETVIVEEIQDCDSAVVMKQGSIMEELIEGISDEENISPNTSVKRSVAEEDVKLTKSEKRHASTEMKFRTFSVNWTKIGDNIIGQLNRLQEFRDQNPDKSIPRGVQFPKSDMTTLTNNIVDQMRCIDTEISACTMESVARQVHSKYSGLNFIDDDGCINHNSHVALKHKLINRNSYLNRFKDPDAKLSVAEVRRNKNVKAGTLKEYWTAVSKDCSKDIVGKLVRNDPKVLNDEFLSVSQSYVRFRLDEPKNLKDIVTGLPILRRRQLISYHFEKATGVPMDTFEKLFVGKRTKIVDFLKSRPKIGLDHTPSDYDIIASLCSLLGENVNELIIQKEVSLLHNVLLPTTIVFLYF